MLLQDLPRYFNPRSLWGAMSGSPGRRGRWYISIRAPRVGSDDLIRDEVTLGGVISIRTPRVGSDSTKRCKVLPCLHFNPHSPCGERSLHRNAIIMVGTYFNPHSPCGERLTCFLPDNSNDIFQSALPVWGATAKTNENPL